jgi:hypothetical protein
MVGAFNLDNFTIFSYVMNFKANQMKKLMNEIINHRF